MRGWKVGGAQSWCSFSAHVRDGPGRELLESQHEYRRPQRAESPSPALGTSPTEGRTMGIRHGLSAPGSLTRSGTRREERG